MIDDEEIMEEEEVKKTPLFLTMSQRDVLIGCLRKALRWMKEQRLLEDMIWIGISGTDRTKPIHDNKVLGAWKNGVGNNYPTDTNRDSSIALSPQRHSLWYLQAILDIAFPRAGYSATWPNDSDREARRLSGIHLSEHKIREVIEELERK